MVIPRLKGKNEAHGTLEVPPTLPPLASSDCIFYKCPKCFMAEMFQLIFSSRQTRVITRNQFHDSAQCMLGFEKSKCVCFPAQNATATV